MALAQRAYDTKRFALAALLWSEALDAEPAPAADRRMQHAYNAACSALLAAAEEQIAEPERAALRARALAWLEAELAAWDAELASDSAPRRAAAVAALQHWQNDPDLASVRGPALECSPEPERTLWTALWSDVARRLTPVEAAAP